MNAIFSSVVVAVSFAVLACCQDCEEPPNCTYPDGCKEPQEVGPCKALIPKYYLNSTTRKCEPFKWGGCCANCNNFQALNESERKCLH
ncbi:hypothetical protein V5799_010500 [Amblyomma americanum]|uniref:BPTI/Kunitz inhibitor domain-containing protein n=1 Tax=Amblyomma americanum TaxID=6943 RepID=A0AAQ4EJK2_AMBAM